MKVLENIGEMVYNPVPNQGKSIADAGMGSQIQNGRGKRLMREVQSGVRGSESHQVMFPLAVGAIFVVALVLGALVG